MHRSIGIALLTLVTATACSDGSSPPTPTEVLVTPTIQTVASVGQTVQFSAEVRDQSGNPMTGVEVTWSVIPSSVADISATGLATAVANGDAVIRASASGVSGEATFIVDQIPASIEVVEGDEQVAAALSRVPTDPTVRVTDALGAPVPGESVRFEVIAGGGLVVPINSPTNSDGRASTAWTLGEDTNQTQILRATARTLSAEFTATAEAAFLAVRTLALDFARETLTYSATLDALGGTAPYTWSLASGNLPAGVALSEDGVFNGTPTTAGSSPITVRVTDAMGSSATRELNLKVCEAPLSLAAGGVFASDPVQPGQCAPFLPADAGARYRVGVVRLSHSQTNPSDAGYAATATLTAIESGVATVASATTMGRSTTHTPATAGFEGDDLDMARATAAFHAEMFRQGAELRARFGPNRLLDRPEVWSTTAAQTLATAVDPPDRIVVKPFANSGCTAPDEEPGHLIAFNDHLAIYQDSTQRTTNAVSEEHAQAVLDYFETHGQSTILDYFGAVTDIDGDGRVAVFISPVVTGNIAAFVWPGDLLETTRCAASNQRELIYFGANMFNNIGGGNFSAMPIMVHEMKHVSSLGRRWVNNSFHPSWIEEGSAEIAAEISSRRAMAAEGILPQGSLLDRDAFPASNIAAEHNYGVLIRISRTTRSYSSPTNSLTSNPSESPDHTFYGTSWHLHRFLGDAYGNAAASADGAFFLQLNDSLSNSGVQGIEAATGQNFSTILEQYAVAMMLNGTAAPQPARRFTTYDFTTATRIFKPEFQPPGDYPWPESGPTPLPFDDVTVVGNLAPAGMRIHEFESDGIGDGIEIRGEVQGGAARVVIVRVE